MSCSADNLSGMTQKLAFIGMGIMGRPMAGHLLSAGYPLTVYSRTKATARPLLDQGAVWADSPKQAASQADVVFVCVTDTPDVQAVLLGPSGVIEAARPGLFAIDHSTISPSVTRSMAAKLQSHGVTLIDAPVSGGDIGAINATLSIMVGGPADAFALVRPMLERMGKTITHCGSVGSGQLTKLVNQVLGAITNLAVCEAMTLVQHAGLDSAKTIAAVASGAAGSWQLTHLAPRMLAGDFAPGFMVDLQLKDLRLAIEEAECLGLNLEALKLVTTLFKQVQSTGGGKLGTQALFKAVNPQ